MKTQENDLENGQANIQESPKSGFKGMWMMALCCGAPVLGVIVIGALGLQSVILENLIYLACPIGMVFMMFMMRGKKHGAEGSETSHACCTPMPVKKEEKVENLEPIQDAKISSMPHQ